MIDAPERIWADWSPADEDTMPATIGCYTPKCSDVVRWKRVDYVRADLVEALPAVQPMTVRLVFNNADATPKTTVLDVSAEAVPDIMAWYGAYCARDRYTATVDGRNVPMDQNGEPAHVNETPKSEHEAAVMLTPVTKGAAHD